jgi:pyruvate,water dikinase
MNNFFDLQRNDNNNNNNNNTKGCRSSSSAEDLIGFSGAGLYDSFTHKFKSEGPLDATIRQVYSSVFTNRAFAEREIYGYVYWCLCVVFAVKNTISFFIRIDHLKVYMGVLVHLPFGEEQANGVLVYVL